VTWFKVDDGFYSHPKMFDAPDAAVALWTRAGSWSARNLSDGFVPAGIPARLCGDPETAVEELINRGVWRRARGGYQFHDWHDYNPSKEKVLDDRAKDAEKKRRMRAELARKRRSPRPRGTPSGLPRDSRGDAPRDSPSSRPGVPPSSGPPEGAAAAGGSAPPGELTAEQIETNRRGVAAARAALDGRDPAADRPPRCPAHDALPPDDVPACGDCARLGRDWRALRSRQNRAEARNRRLCPLCDAAGRVLAPDGQTALPHVPCRHPGTAPEVPSVEVPPPTSENG